MVLQFFFAKCRLCPGSVDLESLFFYLDDRKAGVGYSNFGSVFNLLWPRLAATIVGVYRVL